ncbi:MULTISPECIES: hypothetical protein [Pseudofrankia]|uniref:hypothetical protein n=1 Tax=Pseudofrankia TaxID=2994363 RepID=UPI000234BF94|nr:MULTISPECIES: hypothetical protein [Pseudofrankia]
MSSDENTARGIPIRRLEQYAAVYSAPRSDKNGKARVADEEEVTPEERAGRDALLAQLTTFLKDVAAPDSKGSTARADAPRGTWRFGDGAHVRIVCGLLPETVRSDLTSTKNLNYTELLAYADLDSLVELFGHIRAENPLSDVRFRTSSAVVSDDMSGHLVLLGGLGWNQAVDWYRRQVDFPVEQIEDEEYPEGEIFVIHREGIREKVVPTISGDLDFGLRDDVGLLVRTPNPYNRARTLTICNGVYSRGVLGSVRCLTDGNLKERNERYIQDRFGDSKEFGILMRVRVLRGRTITPDLHDEEVRIFEWPERI